MPSRVWRLLLHFSVRKQIGKLAAEAVRFRTARTWESGLSSQVKSLSPSSVSGGCFWRVGCGWKLLYLFRSKGIVSGALGCSVLIWGRRIVRGKTPSPKNCTVTIQLRLSSHLDDPLLSQTKDKGNDCRLKTLLAGTLSLLRQLVFTRISAAVCWVSRPKRERRDDESTALTTKSSYSSLGDRRSN